MGVVIFSFVGFARYLADDDDVATQSLEMREGFAEEALLVDLQALLRDGGDGVGVRMRSLPESDPRAGGRG